MSRHLYGEAMGAIKFRILLWKYKLMFASYRLRSLLLRTLHRVPEASITDTTCEPIFIVGMGRSGNTLLARMLHEGGYGCFAPENYTLPQAYIEYLRNFGRPWEEIVEIVLGVLEGQEDPWRWGLVDGAAVRRALQRSQHHSFGAIVRCWYENYALATGYPTLAWGCKTPNLSPLLDVFKFVFPRMRAIYIERDPVAVVSSFGRTGLVLYQEPVVAASEWAYLTLLYNGKLVKFRDASLSFEDMVTDPERCLSYLVDRLELKSGGAVPFQSPELQLFHMSNVMKKIDSYKAVVPSEDGAKEWAWLRKLSHGGGRGKLDFIIVGAQKAGTTSLAAYLRNSQQIYIPPEKELPFYADDRQYALGENWFFGKYFSKAVDGQLCGTSTPQYLMYPECFERLRRHQPDAKIIVLLRDPVSRLISHYDMAVRLGKEKRSISEAITAELDQIEACRAAVYDSPVCNKLVTSGEYGRALTRLFEHFDRKQVLIIDFVRLVRDPAAVVKEVCTFIGASPFVLPTYNQKMLGGSKRRINVDHDRIMKAGQAMARYLFPNGAFSYLRQRALRLSYWIDSVNVDPRTKSSLKDIDPGVLARLRSFYEEDRAILNKLGIANVLDKP